MIQPVEIGHTGVEAFGTVAVGVAPSLGVTLHVVATRGEPAVWVKPNGAKGFARGTLEDG